MKKLLLTIAVLIAAIGVAYFVHATIAQTVARDKLNELQRSRICHVPPCSYPMLME